jgi:hypothetical protein
MSTQVPPQCPCPVGQLVAHPIVPSVLHPYAQVEVVEALQDPAPLQTAAVLSFPLKQLAPTPHKVLSSGKTQVFRFKVEPSQIPAHSPVPAQAVRGVVVGTQVPLLPKMEQDSHCPVQATLQQTPSAQTPEAHVFPLEHAAPRPARVSGCCTGASGIGAASTWIPPVATIVWPPVAITPPLLPAVAASLVVLPPDMDASKGIPPVATAPASGEPPVKAGAPPVLTIPPVAEDPPVSIRAPPLAGEDPPEPAGLTSTLVAASRFAGVVVGSSKQPKSRLIPIITTGKPSE